MIVTRRYQLRSGSLLKMVRTSIFLLCLLGTISIIAPIHVMFEKFEYINGTGLIEMHARVHKINRTTAALFGNVTVTADLGVEYEFNVEMFHSRLGNSQFNRYPMKIGPVNVCTFTKKVWPDYYPFFEHTIDNIIEINECPVRARKATYRDVILDPKMFPRYPPPGLWKAAATLSNGKQFAVVHIYFKLYNNEYF